MIFINQHTPIIIIVVVMIIKFIKVEWRESSTNEQQPLNPTHKFLSGGGGPYSLDPKSL